MEKALENFIEKCSAMLEAQVNLAVESRVDFSGVYIEVFNARKFARAWLNELSKEK